MKAKTTKITIIIIKLTKQILLIIMPEFIAFMIRIKKNLITNKKISEFIANMRKINNTIFKINNKINFNSNVKIIILKSNLKYN